MERSFVSRNIRKCISYSDIIKNSALDNETKRKSISDQASSLVDSSHNFQGKIKEIIIKGKPAYTASLNEYLLLKLVAQNLKKTYSINISDRKQINARLTSFLKESAIFKANEGQVLPFALEAQNKT